MQKILIALAICLTFGLTIACASGGAGAELYNKKCAKCHGPDGAKTSGASGGVMLKGQAADAIKTKLMGYRDGSYGGDKKKTMMRMIGKFTDQEIADLAAHIGSL